MGKVKKNTAPVMNLRMDSSTPEAPQEVESSSELPQFQMPCTLTGLGSGLSGGALGFVFGFGGYWVRNMRGGKWKASLAEGWGSAQTFAIMGGLYAAVSCFMQRLRQKNDAWNGAASGCATGLALGWKQGPLSALQSCAMLGAFSFFVDGMGAGQAEAAAAAAAAAAGALAGSGSSSDGSGSSSGSAQQQQRQHGQGKQRGPVELLLSPAVPLLAAVAPCAFGGGCASAAAAARDGGGSGSSGGVLGCRVARPPPR